MFLGEDDRHPVVDLGEVLIRGRHDDRTRFQHAPIRSLPTLPQSRTGEHSTIGAKDVPRLLDLAVDDLPLVVAGGGDQASPLFERTAKRQLQRDRLPPRIDQLRTGLRVFRPTRHQPPLQRLGETHRRQRSCRHKGTRPN